MEFTRTCLRAAFGICLSGATVVAAGPLPPPATDASFDANGVHAAAKVELGRQLFFDKILSGNLNISCATCHHPLAHGSDGLSLPVGEGGVGLGVTRDPEIGDSAIRERVPRNSPHLFNLGAREFDVLFHDGRVEVDPGSPTGFRSPAGANLPPGLDNLLAVQAMFPVTSAAEMAGDAGENPQADRAAANDHPGVWAVLTQKLRETPAYVDLFRAAYPQVQTAAQVDYVLAANAIAAYEAAVFRADNSPFDRYLRGVKYALTVEQARGMRLFYGKAGCDACHAGTFQTDHGFHAIAMPQIGPGKGDGADGVEDFGRGRVTHSAADNFHFITPSLRNVALTAPYGHAGTYATLEAVIRHHLDPVESLYAYNIDQARLPPRDDLDSVDVAVLNDPAAIDRIAAANELAPMSLSAAEIEDLVLFLHALTDPAVLDQRLDVPMASPSGLPVYD